MDVFQEQNGKVVILPGVLVTEPFRTLWDEDKHKGKPRAMKEILFVYHMVNRKSLYHTMPEADREKQLIKDFWERDVKVSDRVRWAVDEYRRMYETPIDRLANSAMRTAEKFVKYFDNINFDERTPKGDLVYTPTEILNNLKVVGQVVDSLKKLMKAQEDGEEKLTYGQFSKNYFEEPEAEEIEDDDN